MTIVTSPVGDSDTDIIICCLTSDACFVGNADGADGVVCVGRDLPGAPGAVSVGVDQIVPGHGVIVTVVHIIRGIRVLNTGTEEKSAAVLFTSIIIDDIKLTLSRYIKIADSNKKCWSPGTHHSSHVWSRQANFISYYKADVIPT